MPLASGNFVLRVGRSVRLERCEVIECDDALLTDWPSCCGLPAWEAEPPKGGTARSPVLPEKQPQVPRTQAMQRLIKWGPRPGTASILKASLPRAVNLSTCMTLPP